MSWTTIRKNLAIFVALTVLGASSSAFAKDTDKYCETGLSGLTESAQAMAALQRAYAVGLPSFGEPVGAPEKPTPLDADLVLIVAHAIEFPISEVAEEYAVMTLSLATFSQAPISDATRAQAAKSKVDAAPWMRSTEVQRTKEMISAAIRGELRTTP
jgi:hypothetical protein